MSRDCRRCDSDRAPRASLFPLGRFRQSSSARIYITYPNARPPVRTNDTHTHTHVDVYIFYNVQTQPQISTLVFPGLSGRITSHGMSYPPHNGGYTVLCQHQQRIAVSYSILAFSLLPYSPQSRVMCQAP